MNRRERRRQRLQRGRRRAIPRWLILTVGGMVSALALVLILLAAMSVFSGPDYFLTSQEVAQLASTGHSMGSPDAPVTVLEFGDFQ